MVRVLACVGVWAMAFASSAQDAKGALLHQYDANAASPAPQPDSAAGGNWIVAGTNTGNTPRSAGNEMGTNFWNIQDSNPLGNSSLIYNRNLAVSDLTDPAGWWARVVVRVPSASAHSSGTIFHIRTDTDPATANGEYYGIAFVNDGAGEYVGYVSGATGAPIVKLGDAELDAAYVTVDAAYDPATQAVTVYYNGVPFADMITTDETSNTGQALFGFGSNNSPATGEHHWALAQFHSGAIPEPASLGLVALAGLSLCRRVRREELGVSNP